jgi:catechol 2,3-dioxygenase-like lactoylglutathione lyase family enzyme
MERPLLRINHVELTVPHGFVAANGDAVATFFADIFGFRRNIFPGLEAAHLVLASDDESSQFLFLCEAAEPAILRGDDHLGFHLDDEAEVDAALARCRAHQLNDPRVEIRLFDDLDLERTVTHAFYLRYLLPIWIDVQHIRAKPGFAPRRRWHFGEALVAKSPA